MLYYRYRNSGLTQYRKEKNELLAKSELARAVFYKAVGREGEDLDRLALADLAEEEGYTYLAMFLRKNITTKQPAWSKKKRKKRS